MKVFVSRQGHLAKVALPTPALVSRVVRTVLRSEKKNRTGDVNVIFVDRRAIKKLNHEFLDERGETDVIAFPYDSLPGKLSGPFADLYIAVPVAVENAKRFGDPPKRELIRVIVHGLLHVLGYDDHRPADRTVMWKKQERLVNRLHPAPR